MKKHFVSLLLAAFFTIITVETKAQRLTLLVESGDAAFANNNFYGAAVFYHQAILKDSTDIKLQYKYAQASRLNLDYDIADHWYTKVYDQDKQGIQFPECVFWLATVKKSKVNYQAAKDLFIQYVQKNKDANDSYFLRKAKQEVAACEYAQWLISNPDTKITMIHLDTSVNSNLSEFAPYIVDSMLYFSSLRNAGNRDKKNLINYNKIYSSVKSKTKWEEAKVQDTLFNEDNIHSTNTSFNTEKTKMYVNHCKQKNAQDFICDIYSSELKNNVWSPLKKLPPEINADGYTNSQPVTGYLDGKEVLFFSSNRPGGEGKIDIWYSKINNDGTYDAPVNAGKKINSEDDEITPFYCNQCKELFFSSTWHKGLGGFDVFKSAYKNGSFEEPQNLGAPINSPYNDIYFSLDPTNTQAFLSSNRTGSLFEERENCCNDIYMYNIPVDSTAIKARQKAIADSIAAITLTSSITSQMKAFTPIMLYFHNDEPDRQSLTSNTSINYKTHYKQYSAKRKLYKKVLTKGKEQRSLTVINKKIDLFFDSVTTGMHHLNAFTRLLADALKDGATITITIKSYCSPLASDKYNEHLAKRRIRSIENYFKEYKNGVLKQYINNDKEGGSVKFKEDVIGESEKKSKISDSFSDIKKSVFNLKAAYERRVEITFDASAPGH